MKLDALAASEMTSADVAIMVESSKLECCYEAGTLYHRLQRPKCHHAALAGSTPHRKEHTNGGTATEGREGPLPKGSGTQPDRPQSADGLPDVRTQRKEGMEPVFETEQGGAATGSWWWKAQIRTGCAP